MIASLMCLKASGHVGDSKLGVGSLWNVFEDNMEAVKLYFPHSQKFLKTEIYHSQLYFKI
jgi:hypothetical protein